MDNISEKNNIYKKFGIILKNFRNENNLTQEQLAEKLGISFKYISRIETGNGGLKTQTLINYMNILGISPNLLYADLITNETVLDDIEISKKMSKLSIENKLLVSSIIDLIVNEKNSNI